MALPIYNTSAALAAPLGSEYVVGQNRVFRYAKNGPAALAVGTVLQGPRPNDSHSNMACAAQSVGKNSITVTLDRGDPVLINEYKGGYLYVNDQAGEGHLYDVESHPNGGGEDSTLRVVIRDHTVVALTTSSQATLTPNSYSGVNKPGGDPWDILVGVTPVAVPSNEYFWCQVRGPAVVKQEGALFAGRGVMSSRDKPGAVAIAKQVVPTQRESFPGQVKETSGTGTITVTSITVTHGLGSTPLLQDITIIQGENPTEALTAFWVDTIGATTFQVNCEPDPGTSDLLFAWRAKASSAHPHLKPESEPRQYSQKAIERRLVGSGKFDDDELLTDISGKATIPERVIGYCINPRVSTEHALIYLTLS